jgi:phenolic acid decarboxylase
MSEAAREAERIAQLKPFIGKHLVYTYENGWQYEIYVKNSQVFDYRIHSGIVGERWVTDQQAHIHAVSPEVLKISWDEPTGTSVSLTVNLGRRELHGVIFFPRWVINDPKKTVCYQNEHLELMRKYRDEGPTYPREVIDEFAQITFIEDCGPDRSDVINCAPAQLPADWVGRK